MKISTSRRTCTSTSQRVRRAEERPGRAKISSSRVSTDVLRSCYKVEMVKLFHWTVLASHRNRRGGPFVTSRAPLEVEIGQSFQIPLDAMISWNLSVDDLRKDLKLPKGLSLSIFRVDLVCDDPANPVRVLLRRPLSGIGSPPPRHRTPLTPPNTAALAWNHRPPCCYSLSSS